jgi:predicted nucleic acid-binding Zn ribbon protein
LPDPDDTGPEPRPLPEVLDQVLADLGVPAAGAVVTVSERWADLVGAEVAPHATPLSIEHGRLTVVADGPAWASHLRWAEAELLTRLGDLIGPDVVTSVAFRVGRS